LSCCHHQNLENRQTRCSFLPVLAHGQHSHLWVTHSYARSFNVILKDTVDVGLLKIEFWSTFPLRPKRTV
jgi:hypothetical protein